LTYTLRFDESASGLQVGTPVTLRGVEIGDVTQAQLVYDAQRGNLFESAKMSIDPGVVQVVGAPHGNPAEQSTAVREGLARLVTRGLRAQLVTASFLTGQKVIGLDIVHDAPVAKLSTDVEAPEFPTTRAADVDAIMQSLQNTLHHIDTATAGPALGNAVKNLDATLSHLEQITRDVQPQLKPLIASLKATADAAQVAAQSASGTLGPDGALATQLPGLLQQVSDAARSLRELADFLAAAPRGIAERPARGITTMKIPRWIARTSALAIGSMTLAGCHSLPPLHYYALDAVAPAAAPVAPEFSNLLHIRHLSVPHEWIIWV